jgi:DNA polymerase-1
VCSSGSNARENRISPPDSKATGADPRPATGPVVLVDGHSIAYRAYFGLIRSPLRNSRGQNTSAVFGFINSLKRLLARFTPEHAAVVFDAPGKTFRHGLFEEYKIQRPRMPDDLITQLPIIKQVTTALGIRTVEIPGVEADDVLGTLTRQFSVRNYPVCLVTSDKDLLQLVDERVRVFDPFKDLIYDRDRATEKFGIPPERMRDFLALSGDSSDNIPGVPGIGDKRAQALLLKYGSLDNALAQEPVLEQHRAIALLSRDLATIRTDLDLDLTPAQLHLSEPDRPALVRIFTDLEFTSLLRDLLGANEESVEVVRNDTLSELAGARRVGITTDDQYCYLTNGGTGLLQVPLDRPELQKLALGNPDMLKVGFDLKQMLRKFPGADIPSAALADVMIADWLLDPNRRSFGLPEMVLRVLGRAVSESVGERTALYALQLYDRLEPLLNEKGLTGLFQNLEMPLVPVLAAMELRGVAIDKPALVALSAELGEQANLLEKSIWHQAGTEFNISSPRQLSQVLFEKLGLKPGRRTKTGYSTDASVLQELAPNSPVVADILRLRELTKLRSTYLDPLAEKCDPATGRVHTSFNQTGTATGRLSTSEPNLQNIPIRGELGRKIRRAFIAPPGSVLVSADYSQIELRVLAELTGDENLKAAFARGDDIHARTAAALFQIGTEGASAEQRRIAKMVNFGIAYGMSDYGLASRLGMSREEARAFIDAYFALYPAVRSWSEKVVEEAARSGYSKTLFGRIRPINDLQSKNRQAYEAARRAAVNTPIQGTAADIMKRAMIAVHHELTAAGISGGMVLQIHDELLLEVRESEADAAARIARKAMQSAWSGSVRLETSVGIGRNWAEIH